MNKIIEYSKRPEVYATSSAEFWDDMHISKEMLKSHLHPTFDGASRNHEFIQRSVEWINTIANPQKYNHLLDLGCGPGLYTERLYQKGYTVEGIDFSKNSIAYAKNQAKLRGYNIQYLYQNYLELSYCNMFDVVLLIYCDYAALTYEQQEILLEKIYSAMKKGGKFIFDVFTQKKFESEKESKNWHIQEGSGFWKPDTSLVLKAHLLYSDNITLDQYLVVDKEDKVNVYRIWNRYYSKEAITKELKKAGFKNIKIYSDVAGKAYDDEADTMCIVVEK